MRWNLGPWVALYVTTGCTNFVGSDTAGSAESGASTSTTEVSSSADTAATTTSPTATDTTASSSIGTTPLTTDASDTTGDSKTTSSGSTDATAACDNGVEDGNESDVDCGGACRVCEPGEGCNGGTDCSTEFCTPSSLCGLQAPIVWLDALDTDTLYNEARCTDSSPAAGEQIYCWENKGSHGGRFVVDGGRRPTYQESPDGVAFDDDDTMRSSGDVFTRPLGDVTVFLVQQEVGSANSFDFNLNHPNQDPTRYSSHVPWGDTDRHVVFDIGGAGTNERIETGADVIAVGETHLFAFVNSAADAERLIRIDGSTEVSEVGALSSRAGAVSVGNGSQALMHEFRVYSPSPTALQRQVIEGQLACRWDLRDRLPGSHPFYDADGTSQGGCPPSL